MDKWIFIHQLAPFQYIFSCKNVLSSIHSCKFWWKVVELKQKRPQTFTFDWNRRCFKITPTPNAHTDLKHLQNANIHVYCRRNFVEKHIYVKVSIAFNGLWRCRFPHTTENQTYRCLSTMPSCCSDISASPACKKSNMTSCMRNNRIRGEISFCSFSI